MIKLIAAASLTSFFFGLFGVDWEAVDEKIEREFPTVEAVSTPVFYERYSEPGASLPLIIDVRKPDEFRVSHLRGAMNFESADSISTMLEQRGLGKDTIVYCSVGYRSAAVAAELQSSGYTSVLNLEHSLFEWAERGFPMINSAGPTDKVHPFNRAWGSLIDDSLHAYPD